MTLITAILLLLLQIAAAAVAVWLAIKLYDYLSE